MREICAKMQANIITVLRMLAAYNQELYGKIIVLLHSLA